MNILGYNISTDYPDLSIDSKIIVNTINPHSYCVSKKDSEFEQALKESDVLLPDGIGIVWAVNTLNSQKIHKIAGFDIFIYLMKHLNNNDGSCLFLGASDETLALIHKRCAKDFPNVTVDLYSPPYKSKFTQEDSKKMCDYANKSKSDVIFVGMTAPKQEKWVYQNKNQLNANVICSIGAVFDFYAGTVKRPSSFWIKIGLEWLPRFLKEPKRLAERNLISTPKFILEVFCHKFLGKGFLNGN